MAIQDCAESIYSRPTPQSRPAEHADQMPHLSVHVTIGFHGFRDGLTERLAELPPHSM